MLILRSIKNALLEPSIEDVSRAGVLAKFPRIRDRNYKFMKSTGLISIFPLKVINKSHKYFSYPSMMEEAPLQKHVQLSGSPHLINNCW